MNRKSDILNLLCNFWTFFTICMDWYLTNSFYRFNPIDFTVHCPICHKLHMHDRSPGLMTSTYQYSLTVIVPLTGNRKLALCQQKSSDLHDIYIVWATLDIEQHKMSIMLHPILS